MLRNQAAIAALLLMGSLAASPAHAGGTFEIHVEAFSPAGVPLGEQTVECSAVEPCSMSFVPASGEKEKAVVLSISERQPGVLRVLALQGPFRVGAGRLANEPGATGEVKAVTKDANRSDAVLMTFQVTRR